MSELLNNALVINSNLAQPILKAAGEGTYGDDTWTRLQYYGRAWYKNESADPARLEVPHLLAPEDILYDEFSSVYGFTIPDQIRLRVLSSHANTDKLTRAQRDIHNKLRKLGHGVTLLIDTGSEATSVSIEEAKTTSWKPGVQWTVTGKAECNELDAVLHVRARGVRGHAVQPTPNKAGLALLNYTKN